MYYDDSLDASIPFEGDDDDEGDLDGDNGDGNLEPIELSHVELGPPDPADPLDPTEKDPKETVLGVTADLNVLVGQRVTLYHNDMHLTLYALQFTMAMVSDPEAAFEALQSFQIAVAAGEDDELGALVSRLIEAHKAEVKADPNWHERAAERMAANQAKHSLIELAGAARSSSELN